uniref:uncharacterized protein LOC109959083 isoform X2 n=1 Tax=Monopterus albus TaxID=43700 RepID=UPI0009B4122C|nr:uncharacterized protein LOC109959083 isoform X2 [Monopterus albus]
MSTEYEDETSRPELPQQHACSDQEVLTDQQLCKQERDFSLPPEGPEPPHIKEEREEFSVSQEQLELKQETDTFMLIPKYEESDSEDEIACQRKLLEKVCKPEIKSLGIESGNKFEEEDEIEHQPAPKRRRAPGPAHQQPAPPFAEPKIAANKIKKKRCKVCGPQKDRKTQYTCFKCNKYICNKHTVKFCPACVI